MADARSRPDWVQADPQAIAAALARSQALPSGGWFVLDASRVLARASRSPRPYTVNGTDLAVWRDHSAARSATAVRSSYGETHGRRGDGDGDPCGAVRVAPAACPHMGADLCDGRVERASGDVICSWHGMLVPGSVPVYDDGVLTWVRLGESGDAAALTDAPIRAARPSPFLDAVIRVEATCEPRDVIANRLDPWHGVHLHPYSFSRLEVVHADDERLDLVVAYRVIGRFAVEVTARFHCPEPRTIVMTILDGEGTGSVVETHATPTVVRDPLRPWVAPRTAIIEATLATSERPGFRHSLRAASLLRPVIGGLARRLWRDDARYAERLYSLRSGSH